MNKKIINSKFLPKKEVSLWTFIGLLKQQDPIATEFQIFEWLREQIREEKIILIYRWSKNDIKNSEEFSHNLPNADVVSHVALFYEDGWRMYEKPRRVEYERRGKMVAGWEAGEPWLDGLKLESLRNSPALFVKRDDVDAILGLSKEQESRPTAQEKREAVLKQWLRENHSDQSIPLGMTQSELWTKLSSENKDLFSAHTGIRDFFKNQKYVNFKNGKNKTLNPLD